MSCTEYVKSIDLPDGDIENFLRNKSALDGPLCATKYLNTSCQQQCLSMTKDYQGCFSCLSNTASCTSGFDQAGEKITCCPLIAQATACSNCLGLHGRDRLARCLRGSGNKTVVVVIIVTICVIVIVGVFTLVWFLRQRNKQKKVADDNQEVDARPPTKGAVHVGYSGPGSVRPVTTHGSPWTARQDFQNHARLQGLSNNMQSEGWTRSRPQGHLNYDDGRYSTEKYQTTPGFATQVGFTNRTTGYDPGMSWDHRSPLSLDQSSPWSDLPSLTDAQPLW